MLDLESNETHYTVREAVLISFPDGSAWKVRFAPLAGQPEADEVVILVAARDLDEVTFANDYTLREIQAFVAQHHP
jgi:hypothetical protein